MRILIAPDSFKESCSARQAAEALANGLRRALPGAELDLCPIADGGEGTVEAFLLATGGHEHFADVTGPLAAGPRARARFALMPETGTAIGEMAAAAGLPLVPAAGRNPERTTTFGVGEMLTEMRDALASAPGDGQRILLGLGGSATVDGGTGAAQALGVRFCDEQGRALTGPLTGGDLMRIATIDKESADAAWPPGVQLVALTDVVNPLVGPKGAAHTFGPQKGATRAQCLALDAGLAHLAAIIRRDLGRDVATLAGAGAAGGLGGGMMGLLGAEIRPGAAAVLGALDMAGRIARADLVIAGEGSFDTTSLQGKGPGEVFRAAARAGKPCVIVAGRVGIAPGELTALGIRRAYALRDRARSDAESMERALPLLEETGHLLGLYLHGGHGR